MKPKGQKSKGKWMFVVHVLNYGDTHTSTEVLWDTNRSRSTPTNGTTIIWVLKTAQISISSKFSAKIQSDLLKWKIQTYIYWKILQ